MNRLKVVIAFAAVILFGGFQDTSAQDYPSRPIKILVGIGAGGITDITMRLYAELVSKNIGQSIIIENRARGGGAISSPLGCTPGAMSESWSLPRPTRT